MEKNKPLEEAKKDWWSMKNRWRKIDNSVFQRACEYSHIVDSIAEIIVKTGKTAAKVYEIFEFSYYGYYGDRADEILGRMYAFDFIYKDVCERAAFLLHVEGKAELV